MRSRLGVPSWRLTSLLVGASLGAASAAHFAGRVLRGESLPPSPVPRRAVL